MSWERVVDARDRAVSAYLPAQVLIQFGEAAGGPVARLRYDVLYHEPR